MAQNAAIDTGAALSSIKRINESVIKIDDGCKKLCLQLSEASKTTNLKSVETIQASFDEVSRNMSALQSNMADVVIATTKYAQEVDAIDDIDSKIFE